MPIIFRLGMYAIYFRMNEVKLREPVHVRIAIERAVPNATKIWIRSNGKTVIANNKSKIPEKGLRRLIDAIEKNVDVILAAWREYFGEIRYFC